MKASTERNTDGVSYFVRILRARSGRGLYVYVDRGSEVTDAYVVVDVDDGFVMR